MGPARSMVFGWIGLAFLNNIPFVFGKAGILFGGGLRPVQLFVNTTITFPQQKLESPFHIFFLLGGISRISPCPAVCLPRVLREVWTPVLCSISRHDALPLPIPRNEFRFLGAYIVMCWEREAGAWQPWQGTRVDGEIGVLGVKLVMMSMLRFLGFGLFIKPRQLLIV